ncbi:MAG: 2-octaprenyl-6-methoxyphenyl hydroxylase [Agarilytica sp.]
MNNNKQENTTELTEKQSDIAIVGGGMAGLSLALLLAAYLPSKKISVIETYPFSLETLYQPSFDQRSTAISSDSARIFRDLNVWSEISEHVTAIRKVQVSDKGHMGRTAYQESDNKKETLGFVVDNAWLGRCLISAARDVSNIELIAPEHVQSLVPRKKGAQLICQNHIYQCELVVIADGANSRLREQLGITVDTFNYRQHAIIANVAFEKPHKGCAFERFTEQGPVALLPLGESDEANTANLVWTTPESQLQERFELADEEFLRALQKVYGYQLGQFTKVSKRVSYPLVRQVAKEQIRSSIVLMGNAAHALHPVAGQGFNLALRDAERLSQSLQEAESESCELGSLKILQQYLDKQSKDQWLTTMISHGFNRIFSDDRLAVQGCRNLGLISLNLVQPVKREFFNQMMGKGSLATF